MDPNVQQRIAECLEACRYFGNPAALPAVIDALNDILAAIERGRHLTMDSQETAQLLAALACLDVHPPGHAERN